MPMLVERPGAVRVPLPSHVLTEKGFSMDWLRSVARPALVGACGLMLAYASGCVSADSYNQLSAERDDLSVRLANTQKDVTSKTEDLAAARNDLSTTSADLSKAKAELSDATTAGQTLQTKFDRLSADLDAAKAKSADVEKRAAEAEAGLADARTALAAAKESG